MPWSFPREMVPGPSVSSGECPQGRADPAIPSPERPTSGSHQSVTRPPAPPAARDGVCSLPPPSARARRLGAPASRDGVGLQAQPGAPSPPLEVLQPSGAGAPQGCSSCQESGPRSRGDGESGGNGGTRGGAGGGRAGGRGAPRPGEEPRGAVRGTGAGAGWAVSAGPPGVGEESARSSLPLCPWQGHHQPWAWPRSPQGCPQPRSTPSWLLMWPWARAPARPIPARG